MNIVQSVIKFLLKVLVVVGTFGLASILIFKDAIPYWWLVITLPVEAIVIYLMYSDTEKEIKYFLGKR